MNHSAPVSRLTVFMASLIPAGYSGILAAWLF